MNIGDIYMHAIFNQTHFNLYLPDYLWTDSNGVMIKGFYDFEPITTPHSTITITENTTILTSESTEIEPITESHPTTKQTTQSTLKSSTGITTTTDHSISTERSTRQRPSTIIPYNSSSRISYHSFLIIITFIFTLYLQ